MVRYPSSSDITFHTTMSSPAAVQISPSEQKDLDKFTKYLAVKAVQVVVQARLGERVSAASKPDTSGGTQWFNLAVKDAPEVMGETKRAMGGAIPSPGLPLVCEISLKTAEGDSLVLEWWRLAVVAGGDPAVKITHTVYNRMSLMLKSLVTVARVTPGYRLSRRQGADSYVICYRVFLGDPHNPPDLGEGALTAKVGQVTTPTTTIVCCVDYRTNMTITQRQASQPILVKSDHFDSLDPGPRLSGPYRREYRHSDCDSSDTGQGVTSDDSQDAMRIFATSPLDREGGHHPRPRADSDSGSVTSQERFKIGAFAGGENRDNLPSLEEELAGEPLLQLLPRPRPSSAISVTSGETVSNTSATTDTDTQFLMSSDSGSKVQLADSRDAKVARPSPAVTEQRVGGPGQGRGRKSLVDLMDREPGPSSVPAGTEKTRLVRRASGGSLFGTTEIAQDFVMVDLKTPFAQQAAAAEGAAGLSSSDPTLGSFFKEVSAAPQLTSLPSGNNLTDQVEMWSSQLNTFEASLQGYDDLLNQMGSGSEAEQEA